MIGRPLNPWLKWCWSFITPAVTAGLMVACVVCFKPITYNSQYTFPVGGQVLGLLVGFTHVVFVPLYFFYALLVAPGVKIKEVK